MTSGIHHVTAIAGGPRRNLDFYTRRSRPAVRQEDRELRRSGHLSLLFRRRERPPGTILTFFPWEHVTPGRLGVGQTFETAFRIPAGAIGYWTQRFVEKGVPHDAPSRRFGETVLAFKDPDGMRLALVGVPGAESEPAWTAAGCRRNAAIRGFHGVDAAARGRGADRRRS